jgi:hypothetical protein
MRVTTLAAVVSISILSSSCKGPTIPREEQTSNAMTAVDNKKGTMLFAMELSPRNSEKKNFCAYERNNNGTTASLNKNAWSVATSELNDILKLMAQSGIQLAGGTTGMFAWMLPCLTALHFSWPVPPTWPLALTVCVGGGFAVGTGAILLSDKPLKELMDRDRTSRLGVFYGVLMDPKPKTFSENEYKEIRTQLTNSGNSLLPCPDAASADQIYRAAERLR